MMEKKYFQNMELWKQQLVWVFPDSRGKADQGLEEWRNEISADK